MWGSYQLRVRVVSWSGTGYDSNGDCCDGVSGWLGLFCDTTCENKYDAIPVVLIPLILHYCCSAGSCFVYDPMATRPAAQLVRRAASPAA